jgi:hypothetical protein
MQARYPFDEIKKWGAVQWASPALKMMFDGQTESVALAVRRTVQKDGYFRIQGLLGKGHVSDDLDDVTPENIQKMEELARSLIDSPAFHRLCEAVSAL